MKSSSGSRDVARVNKLLGGSEDGSVDGSEGGSGNGSGAGGEELKSGE